MVVTGHGDGFARMGRAFSPHCVSGDGSLGVAPGWDESRAFGAQHLPSSGWSTHWLRVAPASRDGARKRPPHRGCPPAMKQSFADKCMTKLKFGHEGEKIRCAPQRAPANGENRASTFATPQAAGESIHTLHRRASKNSSVHAHKTPQKMEARLRLRSKYIGGSVFVICPCWWPAPQKLIQAL